MRQWNQIAFIQPTLYTSYVSTFFFFFKNLWILCADICFMNFLEREKTPPLWEKWMSIVVVGAATHIVYFTPYMHVVFVNLIFHICVCVCLCFAIKCILSREDFISLSKALRARTKCIRYFFVNYFFCTSRCCHHTHMYAIKLMLLYEYYHIQDAFDDASFA